MARLKKLSELAAHLDRPDQVYAMARLNPGRSGLSDRSWVPATMIRNQDFPEGVTSSLGRPWLWMAKPGAWLSDPVAFRQLGVGQFMFGLEGHSLLLLFPGQSFVDLNIDTCQAGRRIRSMSAQDLDRFMKDSGVRHCTLDDNRAVWVPYGWVPMCVAGLDSPDAPLATHAMLPFVNSDMAWARREVMRAVLSSLDSYETGIEGSVGRALDRDLETVRVWLSEALEGDTEVEVAGQATLTAAPASPQPARDNMKPVRVILPPPTKRRRTGQSAAASGSGQPTPAPTTRGQSLLALCKEAGRQMPKLSREELRSRGLPSDYEDSPSDAAAAEAATAAASAGK